MISATRGSAATIAFLVRVSIKNASLRPVTIPRYGLPPANSRNGTPALGSSPIGIDALRLQLPSVGTKLCERQLDSFLFDLPAQVVDPQLLSRNGTQPGRGRLRSVRGPARDQDRREHVGVLEDLLGVAEVHHGLDPGLLAEKPPQRLAVTGLHPLVRHDERQPAARLQQPQPQLVEVHVQVGHAVVGPVGGLQVRLDRLQQFLPDVRRVGDHDIEAAVAEHFGKTPLPVERLGIDRRIGNDAVAHADRVIEAGQRLAAMGRLDPQAQPADLDRLVVQIHAV